LKGVPQGFNQPYYDVEELQYEGIEPQTPNLSFQKNYSTQMSENQSAYLGVRFSCINVYMFTHIIAHTSSQLTDECSFFIFQTSQFYQSVE